MPSPEKIPSEGCASTFGYYLRGTSAGLVIGMKVAGPGSYDVCVPGDERRQMIRQLLFTGSDGAVGQIKAMDAAAVDT